MDRTVIQNFHTSLSARFPTKREIYLVFAVCVLPIHLWSIIFTFFDVPSLILRASIWEIIGVFSYVLVFTLLESLIVLLILVIFGILLPNNLIGTRFVALSATFVFITSIWLISLHSQGLFINSWYLVPYILCLIICFSIVFLYKEIEKSINSIVNRLAPLSYIYVLFDLAGIIIITIRNLNF